MASITTLRLSTSGLPIHIITLDSIRGPYVVFEVEISGTSGLKRMESMSVKCNTTGLTLDTSTNFTFSPQRPLIEVE